jgi:hypothetical protein
LETPYHAPLVGEPDPSRDARNDAVDPVAPTCPLNVPVPAVRLPVPIENALLLGLNVNPVVVYKEPVPPATVSPSHGIINAAFVELVSVLVDT